MHTPARPARLPRLPAVDLARGWAILATLVMHAFIVFGIWQDLPSGAQGVLRTATPTFVVLFGMMLEIVYVPRVARLGLPVVRRQTRRRAGECYAMLLLCAVASMIGGHSTPKGWLATAVFAAPGGYAGILQFYAVALMLVPALLTLRMQCTRLALLAPVAVAWLLWSIPYDLDLWVFNNHAAVLLGMGRGLGPSVAQGLTFVVFGMYLGRAVAERVATGRTSRASLAPVVLFVSLGAGMLVADVARSDLRTTFRNVAYDHLYRGANHPVYYAFGVVGSVAHIGAAWLLLATARLQEWAGMGVLGRRSLFAFTTGNVVHFVVPSVGEGPVSHRLGYALASIVGVIAVTAVYERIRWGRRTRIGTQSGAQSGSQAGTQAGAPEGASGGAT